MAKASLGKTSSGRKKPTKPKKPHPDFPLTPHASGCFCKKVKGRIYYFSADADEALRQWREIKDNLLAGIDPRQQQAGETLAWLVDTFLDSRQSRLDAGEIRQRSFDDYVATCTRLIKHFGKARRLDTLGPMDFGPLKASWQKQGWGPTTIAGEIGRVRVVFKYGYDVDAIDRPIKLGPDFSKPSASKVRQQRHEAPDKMFAASDLHNVVEAADVHLRAMTLLGLNAAYIPADVGRLRREWLRSEWLVEPRWKNYISRQAWLWPETVTAIDESLRVRPAAKLPEHEGLAFLTKQGNPWWREGSRHTPLSSQFTKLLKKVGVHQHGVSFAALRHVFQTIGENGKDSVAVSIVMGHKVNHISDKYREGIDPQRIQDACNEVRDWYLAGGVA